MLKKYFHSENSWLREKEKNTAITRSTKSWWQIFLQKIKQLWKEREKEKTLLLQNKKNRTKIVNFYAPQHSLEIKGWTFNKLTDPSLEVFLFVKIKSTIQLIFRSAEKNILHQSSHLVFEGDQVVAISLKNIDLLDDLYFLQIKDQVGKSQSLRMEL